MLGLLRSTRVHLIIERKIFMNVSTSMPLVLSTCYNHFIPIVDVGKERRTLIGPW